MYRCPSICGVRRRGEVAIVCRLGLRLSRADSHRTIVSEFDQMTVPVLVQQTNGQFSASLVGSPEVRCVGNSRAEAIAALQSELTRRSAAGELVNLEIPPIGVSGLAGRFQDDDALREICEQIYRDRDAQKPQ